ncbi:unnamed protein product [Prorocentrum cordatum]|uniref:Uncharacterized protein n=1 Tax=Prorocentrum cordatum TaxID=2364126 RepID=A0ABN9UP07_9DINO|nr:unnamed protein product [Polarella glacialis]
MARPRPIHLPFHTGRLDLPRWVPRGFVLPPGATTTTMWEYSFSGPSSSSCEPFTAATPTVQCWLVLQWEGPPGLSPVRALEFFWCGMLPFPPFSGWCEYRPAGSEGLFVVATY